MNNIPHYTDNPVHPGVQLKETLDEFGISQTVLSNKIGLSRKVVNEIITGKAPITANTAILLERVLGVPAHIWNNLQKNYELNCAMIYQNSKMEQEYELLKRFPVAKMIKLGWIPEVKSREEKVQSLYSFFGIAKLENYEKSLAIQFRRSIKDNFSKEATFTWLRKGEIEIKKLDTKEFNKKEIKRLLPYLKNLTKTSPDIFQPQLIELCAKAGIAVAFMPELPKTYINGVTFWLNSKKAAILLSLRFKSDDHLWFSFFHELGHIFLHKADKTFIDVEDNSLSEEERNKELEANKFAANTLIPPALWESFRKNKPFSKKKVQDFADRLDIAPGIVVGRLQKEKLIPYSHLNNLKVRFEWVLN